MFLVPIFDANNQAAMYLGIQRDITEQVYRFGSASANRTFILSLIQLFNNLLQPIMLMAEMVQKDPENAKKYAESILYNSNKLSDTVKDVSDIMLEIERNKGDIQDLFDRLISITSVEGFGAFSKKQDDV